MHRKDGLSGLGHPFFTLFLLVLLGSLHSCSTSSSVDLSMSPDNSAVVLQGPVLMRSDDGEIVSIESVVQDLEAVSQELIAAQQELEVCV